jgi:hypothetical protein
VWLMDSWDHADLFRLRVLVVMMRLKRGRRRPDFQEDVRMYVRIIEDQFYRVI